MTKYFCDRCQKELNKDKKTLFITHKEYSKLSFLGADFAESRGEKDILLCEDCTNSFIHWFSNVEEEK